MIIASFYPCPFDIQERHEANATIIKENKLYSCEESKFTSVKQDSTTKFPERSFLMGCKELNIQPSDISYWVFPKTNFKITNEALMNFFSYFKIYFKNKSLFKKWKKSKLFFIDHHLMHNSQSVLSSNFKETAYISADGGGDDGDPRNFVFGEFKKEKFNDKISFYGKESISSFHAYVSDALGMSGGENGKTSGLASYGNYNKKLEKDLSSFLTIKKKYNIFFNRKRYVNTRINLSKIKPQDFDRSKIMSEYPSDTNIFRKTKKYLPQDIAHVTEKIVTQEFIKVLRSIKKKTNLKNIVFSGGLFSNVSLNNKILESKIFKNVFFSVAPTDAGLSLGGAQFLYHKIKKKRFKNLIPYTGPSFLDSEILNLIKKFNLNFSKKNNIEKFTARLISKGNIVGWFQGKSEIGHRALGNRSILADPRRLNVKELVNQHLKKRDWFMPYAPAVLDEDMKLFTQTKYLSPYMQVAFKVNGKIRSKIKSTIHVDNTARIQTVTKRYNIKFWKLIKEFKKKTGLGALMNTSFNRHGIATISSPRQAIEHLLEGCIDYLIISNYIISFKKNRNVKIYSKKIVNEKNNLINLCKKRFKLIKNKLSLKEKKYYLNQLKYLELNVKNKNI